MYYRITIQCYCIYPMEGGEVSETRSIIYLSFIPRKGDSIRVDSIEFGHLEDHHKQTHQIDNITYIVDQDVEEDQPTVNLVLDCSFDYLRGK